MDDIFGQAQLNIMKMAIEAQGQGGEASFMNYYYILIRVRDKYEGDDRHGDIIFKFAHYSLDGWV